MKRKSKFPKVVRDRKNGGYKIKYKDGSLSPEGYYNKKGAEEAIKGHSSSSQCDDGLRDCFLEAINP